MYFHVYVMKVHCVQQQVYTYRYTTFGFGAIFGQITVTVMIEEYYYVIPVAFMVNIFQERESYTCTLPMHVT